LRFAPRLGRARLAAWILTSTFGSLRPLTISRLSLPAAATALRLFLCVVLNLLDRLARMQRFVSLSFTCLAVRGGFSAATLTR
jgi:hypothetical protein